MVACFKSVVWQLLTWLAALALLGNAVASAQSRANGTVSMRQDAGLASIVFVDADRGWAVGDRGVVWHTTDGGRSWRLQNSGTTARLESIAMMDAENGCIVGGFTQPYTHETVGIVLRTRDGGKSWQASPDGSLPYLRHVKFFNPKQGWAMGDGSALFPSGAFYTEDGGKTWTPVAKGETQGWLAGDLRDFRGGALAGRGGQLVAVTPQQMKESRVAPLGKRNPRKMVLWPDARGWLVGDGGLVLRTLDGGHSWSGPDGTLPNLAGDEMDFEAVASLADHVWIAGSPGTLILHSANAGKTWEVFDTQQTTPIKSLFFVDANRGFAACELGVILATLDGGKNWTVQHSGGKRAAMLGIFSQADRVAWEIVAQQAGSEGYLTAVEIIGQQSSTGSSVTLPERTREALVNVGGSSLNTSWRFPMRESEISSSPQSILQHWDTTNDGRAKELIEAHLVRQIRTWRPDVIVTEDVSPRGEDPLGHLTNQMVLSAVQKAADPNAYSGQIFDLHLDVWKPKKVFSVRRGSQSGVVTITPAQWLARLNRSIADQAELGRSLIEETVHDRASIVGLSLLVDHLPQHTGKRDVFSGLVLLPGGEARRELDEGLGGDLENLARAAQKRHNVEQLLSRMDRDVAQGAAWLGQLDELTKGLSEENASEITYQMAMRFQRLGRSDSACEVLHTLLDKHPKHPLAGKAAVWLIEYYSSTETFHRERRESRFVSSIATAGHPLERSEDEIVDEEELKRREVAPAGFASQGMVTSAHTRMTLGERTGKALAVAQQIEKTRPVLHAEPQLRFSLAKAMRQQGQGRSAEKFFNSLLTQRPTDPWARCAEAELWLGSAAGAAPKKILYCPTAVQRPRLDGKLEEEVWRYAKPVSLTAQGDDESRLKEVSSVAVMAFDEDFLYFAASCKRVGPAPASAQGSGPRKHDDDLSRKDRVQIVLDVDRDYGSYYLLSIDSSGRTAESCFGDVTWNPTWFVAAAGDDEFWTVEAAIPLAELVPNTPKAKDVWAIGVQRIVPEQGLQSFTHPAAVSVRPEGLGLLMFE